MKRYFILLLVPILRHVHVLFSGLIRKFLDILNYMLTLSHLLKYKVNHMREKNWKTDIKRIGVRDVIGCVGIHG